MIWGGFWRMEGPAIDPVSPGFQPWTPLAMPVQLGWAYLDPWESAHRRREPGATRLGRASASLKEASTCTAHILVSPDLWHSESDSGLGLPWTSLVCSHSS